MKRILWIDDEPERMHPWRLLLERQGFQVQIALNERQAISQISKRADFHMVIADLFMPSLNPRLSDALRTGVRVCDAFRRCNPIAPVVLFTNARDTELFNRLEAADPKFKVARKRHYDPEQLLALVQGLLRD